MRPRFSVAMTIVTLSLFITLAACETAPFEAHAPLEAELSLTADAKPATGGEVAAQLAEVRAATARYHQISEAEDDQYGLLPPPADECVELPGVGGMGFHYVNFDLFMDPAVDPLTPEALVYEPQKNGKMRLVAVEYIVSWAPGEDEPVQGPQPSLFGQDFHPSPHVGPFGAWTLHVWLWRDNPNGMFADFNPKVSCAYAE